MPITPDDVDGGSTDARHRQRALSRTALQADLLGTQARHPYRHRRQLQYRQLHVRKVWVRRRRLRRLPLTLSQRPR